MSLGDQPLCVLCTPCSPQLTKGTTVADWLGHWGKVPQTLVLQRVDESHFHDIYIDYVKDFAGVEFATLA